MTSSDLENSKQGRWTPEEHSLFVKAINQFGREVIWFVTIIDFVNFSLVLFLK